MEARAGGILHADFVPMLMSEEVWKRWRLLRTKASALCDLVICDVR